MLFRLLTLLMVTTIAVPLFAQQTTPTATTTPAAFAQQKTRIDSLVQVADTIQTVEKAAFRGKARVGAYRVECFYDKPSKEIIKANYLFITDSLNFSKVYYFQGNSLIKINEDNKSNYYQVGDRLLNEQGAAINPAISKTLMGVITDTWQGLYSALFQ